MPLKSGINLDNSKEPINLSQFKKNEVYNNIASEDVLHKSGISNYFPDINDEFIKSRMLYGYISKRSMTSIKYYMKRWFILISAKSVSPYYVDEKIL